jgi:hypothetical protein
MNIIIVLLLIFGMYLIIYGLFEDELRNVKRNKDIRYRFLPRSELEEQFDKEQLNKKVKSIYFNTFPNESVK